MRIFKRYLPGNSFNIEETSGSRVAGSSQLVLILFYFLLTRQLELFGFLNKMRSMKTINSSIVPPLYFCYYIAEIVCYDWCSTLRCPIQSKQFDHLTSVHFFARYFLLYRLNNKSFLFAFFFKAYKPFNTLMSVH